MGLGLGGFDRVVPHPVVLFGGVDDALIDVVAMGELLIDFVSVATGASIKDSPGFTKAPGGAPANVAVGVRRLGHTSGFIGKVGNDDFGLFLGETLAREGVDTRGVKYEDRARTMLAFVSLRPDGEREFMFYRHPSADMLLEPSEIDAGLLGEARVFHHGSISLITEPSRSATLAAVEAARAAGALVSYDPNLRLRLWPTSDEARTTILAAANSADIIKVSEEELAFLTGTDGMAEGVRKLRNLVRPECAIVVTRGRWGCALDLAEGEGCSGGLWLEVPGFDVRAVDTTGAGDAFVAGLLVGLIEEASGAASIAGTGAAAAGTAPRAGIAGVFGAAAGTGTGAADSNAAEATGAGACTGAGSRPGANGGRPVSSAVSNSRGRISIDASNRDKAPVTATTRATLRVLGEAEWRRVLILANAVGALCTTKLGAIPALPTIEEVRTFLHERLNGRGSNVRGSSQDAGCRVPGAGANRR